MRDKVKYHAKRHQGNASVFMLRNVVIEFII